MEMLLGFLVILLLGATLAGESPRKVAVGVGVGMLLGLLIGVVVLGGLGGAAITVVGVVWFLQGGGLLPAAIGLFLLGVAGLAALGLSHFLRRIDG